MKAVFIEQPGDARVLRYDDFANPEPAPGQPGPQTNDVDLDERGLIYLVDRGPGLDVLEFNRSG